MLAPLIWVGRGVVWGLSALGLVKATETVSGATGAGKSAPEGPSLMVWALILGFVGFVVWLAFKQVKKGGA